MNWIKEHPYLTGGLVLGVIVFYVIYSSLSGSSSSGGATVVQAGPSGPDDAVQTAQLQAGVAQQQLQANSTDTQNAINGQLALAQIQANSNAATATIQANSQNNANTLSAQLQSQQSADALSANNQNVGGAVAIAGIQGGVAEYEANAQLQAVQNTNQTSLDINGQNTQTSLAELLSNNSTAYNTTLANNSTALQINAQNTGAAVTINGQNVDAAQNINLQNVQGQVDIAQIQGNTSTQNTQTEADLYGHLADLSSTYDLTQLNNTASIQQQVVQGVNSGAYNKGGSGGANQVSIIGALLGAPSIGTAAEQTAASQNAGSSLSGVISSIGTAVGNAAGGVAAAFVGGGVTGGTPTSVKAPVTSIAV